MHNRDTILIRVLKNQTDDTYLNFQLRESDTDGLSLYNKSAIEKSGKQICEFIGAQLGLPKRYIEILKNYICAQYEDINIERKGSNYHYTISFKNKKLPDDIEWCNKRLCDIYNDIFDPKKIYRCNKFEAQKDDDRINKIIDSSLFKDLDSKFKKEST